MLNEDRITRYVIIFIGLVFLAIVLNTFQAVLRPLAIAVLVIFLLSPLVRFSRDKNVPFGLLFGGLLIVSGIILVILFSYGSSAIGELKSTLPSLGKGAAEETGDLLGKLSVFGISPESITPEKISALTRKAVTTGISTLSGLFFEALFVLIFMMFLIPSYPFMLENIKARLGKTEAERAVRTYRKIEGDIRIYLVTKTLMSLGTAVCSAIALYFFGANYIFISALILFMLNFVPVVGSLVAVGIVVVLYILSFDAGLTVLWLFLVLMIIQIIFGNVLEPKIAGSRLNMSPILILISLSLWSWIWGIIGMLISVPLTLVILIVFRHVGGERLADEIAA
ncbi:MAG: AI-2E family transporter [Deltaproteobacteria bacterium]|nr:AI-2E family transporter [Deltaproteobacteria bacterium]